MNKPLKIQKLWTWEEARELIESWRKKGENTVFTNGCFDILHAGHVALLENAAKIGNRLIVAINSDESVRRIKGPDRPLRPETERAEILGGLACVSGVVIFQQDTPLEIITFLQPDTLVKGGDWKPENIIGADVVKARNGQVVVIALTPGRSTTGIVESLKNGKEGDRKGGRGSG